MHTDPAVPTRVVNAWQLGAQDILIADAAVTDDRLLVRSCALESFEVRFGEIPALARLPESERDKFIVDQDGSYLYWEVNDTHVGLDMIRFATDAKFRETSLLSKLASRRQFGSAVKAVREESELRQSDVPGVSQRQVSRIESGSSGAPRYETLRKLALAHSPTAAEYLDRVGNQLAALQSEPSFAAT